MSAKLTVNQQFYICFKKPRSHQTYRAAVTILTITSLFIRFSVSANKKLIIVEKKLFRKGNTWRMASANFTLSHFSKDNDTILVNIFAAIDEKLLDSSE